MPNWKKLIVSGSDAKLNSLDLSSHITASGNISSSANLTGRIVSAAFEIHGPNKFAIDQGGNISGSNFYNIQGTNGLTVRHGDGSTGGTLSVNSGGASLSGQGTSTITIGNNQNTINIESNGGFGSNGGNVTIGSQIFGSGTETAGNVTIQSLGGTNGNAGTITLNASSINISGDTKASGSFSGSFEGDFSSTGDFTIDAGGDIILDADGTDIIFKDGGTEFGSIKRVSSDFVIKSATSDKDIVFKGNDGGATITALTLDMSDGGKAKFLGGVSGSFEGDGSNLTGITANVAENTTIVDTFSNATSKTVTHNFGTKNVIVQVFDNADKMLLPQEVTTTNNNQVSINLAESTSGRVVVAKGGHIVSQSLFASASTATTATTASHALSVPSSGLPTGIISQSGGIVDLPNVKIQYANLYSDISDLPSAANYHGMFAHVHNTGYGYYAHAGAWIQLQNATEAIPTASFAITASHALNSGGGSGAGFPFSGSAVITGSLAVRNGTISGSFIGNGSALTGVGGTVQEAATFTADFSNAATSSFTHGFGTKNVIVQCYLSGSDALFFPSSIVTTTANKVDVTFSSPTSGRVVIGKAGHLVSSSLDGGNLPGITGSTFTSALSHSINHGFNTKEVVVSVYDSADNLFMPANVKTTTTSSVDITFSSPRSGRAVVSKGGHIITSTTAQNAVTADGLSVAGNRQDISSVTTAVTASAFTTHLLRASVSMSLPVASAGDWIKVANRITSSYAHLVPGGSQKIMGSTESLEVDSDNAGFELIYADSTDGWIIIGN